jgi:hypothetical protein
VPDERLPLELRTGLRAGSVFYFQSRELTSAQPHFFVVVNAEPLRTELLVLTIVTSNLNDVRTRNRTRMQTVVEITPVDYAEFTLPSAIDCNAVLEKPLSDLAGMVRRKEVRFHRDLPPIIFAKVRAAVLASPVVADELKEML